MAKPGVEQNGVLNEYPLAELIREAAAASLTGAFRLAGERVKSVVYFGGGELLFAVSNLRAHRLVESARRWNFVNEHQLTGLNQRASDAEQGAALVSSGALTPEALEELYSLQAASVIRPMLLWTAGTWTFDPRVRLAETVRAHFDLRTLLIEGARRLPPEFITKRFTNTNEMLIANANPPLEVALQPTEAFVLSRIDVTGIRLHELLSISGLPEAETLAALYALALGGYLERDKWPRAFSDDKLAKFKAVDAAVLKKEKETGGSEAAPEQAAAASASPQSKPVAPQVDEKEEIEQFIARVDAAEDFYEVLAVTRSSEQSTIKRAYHALARKFHPDRFHKDAGTPMHGRLQSTFARVAQAHDMLRDKQLRASYDLRLQAERQMRRPGSFQTADRVPSGPKQPTAQAHGPSAASSGKPNATSTAQQAEESFERGMAALKMGNMALAIALLAEAARRNPKEPKYRAYYGRSLAGNSRTRHQAESELQAAISLDANNASYRLMLAELYRELGMKRRAQGEAQRALVIEPKNPDALKLIDELNSKM